MSTRRIFRHDARRHFLKTAALGSAVLAAPAVLRAQEVPIRFTLDWRFEGPAAPYLLALEKGYFKAEKLNVTIDSGAGSPVAIQRVATGGYDMGFGDFSSLTEFYANNPGLPGPAGVYVVYERSPATVFALKGKGIAKPADLNGKKLGAPVFDGGRKAFPIFAQANGIDHTKIQWTSMEPALRETMLVRGEVDAVTGFLFSGLLSLIARGAKEEDIVVMQYKDFGVNLYGSTILASSEMITKRPDAVSGFVRAFNRALKETIAKPEEAIGFVKKRDPLVSEQLELRRLKLCLDNFVSTPTAKAGGLGSLDRGRLAETTKLVVSSFNLKNQVDPALLFNPIFMPPAADRKI
jgi:NitT/TauT family transport system substrate-binding protein